MDRKIDKRTRTIRVLKRCLVLAIVGAVLIPALSWSINLMRPTLHLDQIRKATVNSGPLESTVETSGVVVPEIESVISSPISTRVLKVLKKAGASVNRGEPIVELDTSETGLALRKIAQQVEVKRNAQDLIKLELEQRLVSLNAQLELAELDLDVRSSDLHRLTELFSERLVSQADLDQGLAEKRKAQVALDQIKAQSVQAQAETETELAGLEIEMNILEEELKEARRQARLATTKSDRDGVVTWIISEEGMAVSKGQVLARIADLSSFHVNATASDIYAGRLSPGLEVIVRLTDGQLKGQVQGILPTITDGIMTIVISLQDPESPLLKSNLRADVQVILDRKKQVLRLSRGPGVREKTIQEVFVLRGDYAFKTRVEFGISNFEYLEVISGLSDGDQVIVSDMTDYLHMDEISLK